MSSKPRYAMSARSMVDQYIKGRGIRDPQVLEALLAVPREEFVPETLRERAYSDHPLPIGDDQTISQPYIVALMTEALELHGKEKVLEIGTGSGYQTAILAHLASRVFSVERHQRLASIARIRLEKLGIHNVSIQVGNGTFGWREYSPYDRIIVTASAIELPRALWDQLAEGGIMVIPIGGMDEAQKLYAMKKSGPEPERRFLGYCSFVPFIM